MLLLSIAVLPRWIWLMWNSSGTALVRLREIGNEDILI
jgi:hypothetical protein